jgi:hypothetical protein
LREAGARGGEAELEKKIRGQSLRSRVSEARHAAAAYRPFHLMLEYINQKKIAKPTALILEGVYNV